MMNKRAKWTTEEDNILIEAKNNGLTYKEIVPLLPNRTFRSISVRGSEICPNIKANFRWTEEDEEKLIVLRQNSIPYDECAKILNRSLSAVKTKGYYLIKAGQLESHQERYDDMLAGNIELIPSNVWKRLEEEGYI